MIFLSICIACEMENPMWDHECLMASKALQNRNSQIGTKWSEVLHMSVETRDGNDRLPLRNNFPQWGLVLQVRRGIINLVVMIHPLNSLSLTWPITIKWHSLNSIPANQIIHFTVCGNNESFEILPNPFLYLYEFFNHWSLTINKVGDIHWRPGSTTHSPSVSFETSDLFDKDNFHSISILLNGTCSWLNLKAAHKLS